MSRYAPTLFVGIGGTGVSILRHLKTRVQDQLAGTSIEREPLSFLAIDFDPTANPRSARPAPLVGSEFRFFDPYDIVNCIGNLDRERQYGAETPGKQFEYDVIRDWYPDPNVEDIRPSLAEASGASQWRPLGRIGFYLHDSSIVDAMSDALKELDRRRETSETMGDRPIVYIISSIAGGTGSGMLFDVAVNLRKIRRGISVRAFLLLPEAFESVPFRDRIRPNAYAALWEIANLKNHHSVFHARYLKISEVTKTDSPSPFQRVYLFGPYVGDRRPFEKPSDAQRYIADLIYLTTTRALRDAASTGDPNAAADANVPTSDPTSRHVFCTLSSMGIRLLTYQELASSVIARLAEELTGDGGRRLNLFLPEPSDEARREIARFVQAESDYGAGRVGEEILAEAERLIEDMRHDRPQWRYEIVTAWAGELADFIDSGAAVPQYTRNRVAAFETELRARLNAANAAHTRPFRFIDFLDALRDALPEADAATPQPGLIALRTFADPLRRPVVGRILGRALMRSRLDLLSEWIRARVQRETDDGTATAAMSRAIRTRAREVVAELIETERDQWNDLDRFAGDIAARLPAFAANQRESEQDRAYLDARRVDPADIYEAEASYLTESGRAELLEAFHGAFHRCHNVYHAAQDDTARQTIIEQWIEEVQATFVEKLATVVRSNDPDYPERRYRLVSPTSTFTAGTIDAALQRCVTPVFTRGRVDAPGAIRIARVVIPMDFRHRTEVAQRLRGQARSVLDAIPSDRDEGVPMEEMRIIVMLDDLFHPAEDITGIYDYHSDYDNRSHREYHHIHRDWLREFPPLITRAGARGRISCGNPDCDADIKSLERDRLFCPKCARPIRNRCGNFGCLIDGLSDRRDLQAIVTSGYCPGCKKPLRTYWWQCTDHRSVPMDKPKCPQCIREGRPPWRVSERPDVTARYTCPRCEPNTDHVPFSVTSADLKRFLQHGINDQDVPAAERELGKVLINGLSCPTCGALLVPLCPLPDQHHPKLRHYLYRDPNEAHTEPFRCFLHTLQFLSCQRCQYPVLPSQSACERCGSGLESCRFCTPTIHVLVPGTADLDGRCANCGMYATDADALTHTARRREAPTDRFCSNLYGCPAGAMLDHESTISVAETCAICRNEELPLLEVQTRQQHLNACRFCSVLFDLPSTPPSGNRSGYCCLCGQCFSTTDALSNENFEQALEIARCLTTNARDDDDAFAMLYAASSPQEIADMPRCLAAFRDRVQRPAVLSIVEPRIHDLMLHWKNQFGCRNEEGANECSPSEPLPDTRSEMFDPNWILSYRSAVADWVSRLKRSGITRSSLRLIRESVLSRQPHDIRSPELLAMFDEAERIWEEVDDGEN